MKRRISILLAVILLLVGIIPTAYAAENEDDILYSYYIKDVQEQNGTIVLRGAFVNGSENHHFVGLEDVVLDIYNSDHEKICSVTVDEDFQKDFRLRPQAILAYMAETSGLTAKQKKALLEAEELYGRLGDGTIISGECSGEQCAECRYNGLSMTVDPEDLYPDTATQDKDRCADCNGIGSYTCTYCDGDYDCPDCVEGRREVSETEIEKRSCSFCKGSGVCSSCDGSGTLVSRGKARQCRRCKGKGICGCNGGVNPYSSYDENTQRIVKAICETCDGNGTQCIHCDSGIITCRTCRGTGKSATAQTSQTPAKNSAGKGGTTGNLTDSQQNSEDYQGIRGSDHYYDFDDGYFDDDDSFTMECNRCRGSGKCEDCGGSRKSKFTGVLAAGGCTLCAASGDCYKCGGDGFIDY